MLDMSPRGSGCESSVARQYTHASLSSSTASTAASARKTPVSRLLVALAVAPQSSERMLPIAR